MKKILFYIWISSIPNIIIAQYEPSAINYGVVGVKSFGAANEIGLGVRLEYAPNCYTTYMGEYNRLFSIGSEETVEGYNELAIGVNLILFNWYPTTITAGFGYVGNDSSVFEEIEDDAFIAFTSGNLNHGAQIKLRALYHLTIPVHIFAELNIKSLGRRYDTFLLGISYDFNAR